MKLHTGLAYLLSAFLFTASPPLAAPLSAKERAAPVVIPFNPPLNQPVRYRLRTVQQGGGRDKEISSVEELRFQRLEEGYRLSIKSSEAKVVDERLPPVLRQQMLELAKLPYVIRVSDQGEIVELQDSDALWKRAMDLTDKVIAAELKSGASADGGMDRAALDEYLQSFRNMPKEERLNLMTQSLQPIFQFSPTEWTGPIKANVKTSTMFGELVQKMRIERPTVSGQVASFSMGNTFPEKEMKKMMKQIAQQFAPEGVNTSKLDPKDVKINMTDTGTAQVSVIDGLVLRFENRRTMVLQAGKESTNINEVTTIERVR